MAIKRNTTLADQAAMHGPQARNDHGAGLGSDNALGYLTDLNWDDDCPDRRSCLVADSLPPGRARTMARVRNGEYTKNELLQMHQNAMKLGGLQMAALAKRQLRIQFPRAAKQIFGKTRTTRWLEAVQADLGATVDLGTNKLKNTVKPGGEMLSGRKYVNEYISFRTPGGAGAYLSLEQDTPDSELLAFVGRDQVGSARFCKEAIFTMDAFSDAAAEYIRNVQAVAMTVA